MRIGLLLLGTFPERQLYAAASIARSIRASPKSKGWEVMALTTSSRLNNAEVPGVMGLSVQEISSVMTEDAGVFSSSCSFQADDYMRLTSDAAISCDLWILLDEGTGFPLCMDRPTVLWAPEFTDRYVGGVFPNSFRGWAFGRRAAFINRVSAKTVVVHDEVARFDGNYFAQIPNERIRLLDLPRVPQLNGEPTKAPRNSPYIYWHLAMEQVGTVDNAIAAIDYYMGQYFGQCGLVIGSALFQSGQDHNQILAHNEENFVKKLKESLEAKAWAKQMVSYVFASDAQVAQTWAGHAVAIVLGRGWRANQPVIDCVEQNGRPVLLLASANKAEKYLDRVPQAHVLTGDQNSAAGYLKAAEIGDSQIDAVRHGSETAGNDVENWCDMIQCVVDNAIVEGGEIVARSELEKVQKECQ